MAAAGRVDQQVANVGHAAARVGRALHDDVEDLLLLEDAADLDALKQRGLRAAHVAGLDPVRAGLGEVDLDLHVGWVGRQLDPRGRRRRRPRARACCIRRRLRAQDGQVLAEDAHDERRWSAGQHVEAVARARRSSPSSSAPTSRILCFS